MNESKVCAVCGETFHRPAHRTVASWARRKYCSDACRLNRVANDFGDCAICGARLKRRRTYCSRQCYRTACRQPEDRECLACGEPVDNPDRQYCSAECRTGWRGRVEDVRWLLDAGESPNQIAARLGVQPTSLGRYLYRHGQDEEARVFYRAGSLEHAA